MDDIESNIQNVKTNDYILYYTSKYIFIRCVRRVLETIQVFNL